MSEVTDQELSIDTKSLGISEYQRHRDEMNPLQQKQADILVQKIQEELDTLQITSLKELAGRIEDGSVPISAAQLTKHYLTRLNRLIVKEDIITDWENVHVLKTMEIEDTDGVYDIGMLSNGLLVCDLGNFRLKGLSVVDPDTGAVVKKSTDAMTPEEICRQIDGITSDDRVLSRALTIQSRKYGESILWDIQAGTTSPIHVRSNICFNPAIDMFVAQQIESNGLPVRGEAIMYDLTKDTPTTIKLPETIGRRPPLGIVDPETLLCRSDDGFTVYSTKLEEAVAHISVAVDLGDPYQYIPASGMIYIHKTELFHWNLHEITPQSLGHLPDSTNYVTIQAHPTEKDTLLLLLANRKTSINQLAIYKLGETNPVKTIELDTRQAQPMAVSPIDGRIYIPKGAAYNSIFVLGE